MNTSLTMLQQGYKVVSVFHGRKRGAESLLAVLRLIHTR